MEKDFEPMRKALDRLGYLLHKDEIQAFDEFLEYGIAQHSHTIHKDLTSAPKEVREAYFNVYSEWVKLQYRKIHTEHKGWFDAFGLYFEIHSSKWGRQKKGQFFTPEPICDFMARINVTEDMERQTIQDPTCGSGRLLLASHACNPKNFQYGQDLDRTCCLMSALNMMIHGIQGEVVHGDALNPDSFFSGWAINPNIKQLQGIPHIENLEKENSFIFHVAQSYKKEREAEIKQEEQEEAERLKNANFLEVEEKKKLNFDNSKDKTSFEFF